MEAPRSIQDGCLVHGWFSHSWHLYGYIGKRFGDGGLRNLVVESEVLAAGSVASVLDGKHYNRGMRVHKVVWEALSRLRWRQFERFLEGQGHGCPIAIDSLAQPSSEIR